MGASGVANIGCGAVPYPRDLNVESTEKSHGYRSPNHTLETHMTLDIARPRAPEVRSLTRAPMPVQDDPLTADRLATLDPSGLWRRLAGLPDQAEHAWQLGVRWNGAHPEVIDRVLVVGMGGSAIGAQLAAQILQHRSPVSFHVLRDSELPMTDERTLLVFCSFSGETDEVRTALRSAMHQPGMKVVITRGGAQAREACAEGIPMVLYEYEGEPRSALGYGTMVLLGLLHRFGLFPVGDEEISRTFTELRACADVNLPEIPVTDNHARALARDLADAVPVILADASLASAAVRWQNQCNENGKRWAFSGTLPEALHNIVEGIQYQDPHTAGRSFHVVILEDLSRPGAARARLDALQEHLADAEIPSTRLPFGGSSDLSTLLQACMVGDWVSYYLALEAGIDPSPVPIISGLKLRVAEEMRRDASLVEAKLGPR